MDATIKTKMEPRLTSTNSELAPSTLNEGDFLLSQSPFDVNCDSYKLIQ